MTFLYFLVSLSLSPSSVLPYFADAMLFFSLLLLFDVFFLFIPNASFFILSIVVLLLFFLLQYVTGICGFIFFFFL